MERQGGARLAARPRVGRLTIKKRGVSLDPEAVRRQLRLSGDGEATLVLTRVAGQAHALVVDPA